MNSQYKRQQINYYWKKIFFFCSEVQIRKKANVLFGIKFDGTNYSTLENHLKTIKNNKDLVHIVLFLMVKVLSSNYLIHIENEIYAVAVP